jgi:tRNA-guanine family transglycosylase
VSSVGERNVLQRGTIITVHNLRNTLFLPQYGLGDIPLMVSAADIMRRPYLRRAIRQAGIKTYLGVSGPVIIDSGGFSFVADQNTPIKIDHLISIFRDLGADLYAALDLPPGARDSTRRRSQKWSRTLKNLDRMLEFFGPEHLIPIIHGHSLAEIVAACSDVRCRVISPPFIGLGGMVPFLRGYMSRQRFHYKRANNSVGTGETFFADAIVNCKNEFPASHLHVFGVGSPTTAIAAFVLGADSVDSLAWRRAAGFGTIFLPGLAERIVSHKPRQRYSRPTLTAADSISLENCDCPICTPLAHFEDRIGALADSYVARAVHNVWTLRREEAALRSAISAGKLAEFSVSRIVGRHRFAQIIRDSLRQ